MWKVLLYVLGQWNTLFLKCFLCQLLRGVTISNGGVLPRIHPELLSKKRGGRVKVESQASVPEKQEEHSKNKKPVKSFKKVKGKRGRKPKVSQLSTADMKHTRTHTHTHASKSPVSPEPRHYHLSNCETNKQTNPRVHFMHTLARCVAVTAKPVGISLFSDVFRQLVEQTCLKHTETFWGAKLTRL